jgi:hypothetical protein
MNKITKNRLTRKKPALQHISELGLKCKESTFEKLIYKFWLHHLPGAEKPKLNNGCMHMQCELATLLLGMDLKSVVFINEALISQQVVGALGAVIKQLYI